MLEIKLLQESEALKSVTFGFCQLPVKLALTKSVPTDNGVRPTYLLFYLRLRIHYGAQNGSSGFYKKGKWKRQ